MIPGQFDYVRPGSLGETLQILKDREGDAKLLSGGYSLIPLIKLRLAQPALLVDLQDVSGLDGIIETDDHLVIGARATHRQIHDNEIIQDRYPGIVDITSTIGDPQVRNWGTIGGSVAHADPASDWPAFLLATNATIVCTSQAGERTIDAREFFLDTFTTAIEPTEVLTQIRLFRRPKLGGQRLREARAQGRRLRHGRGLLLRPAGRGRDDQGLRHRRHRGRRRRRSRPRMPRRSSSATPRPRRSSGRPVRRSPRRPIRVATSAVPSNTSGRWPRR